MERDNVSGTTGAEPVRRSIKTREELRWAVIEALRQQK
jgi:hypothetical protein